jgi:hypothetical protein
MNRILANILLWIESRFRGDDFLKCRRISKGMAGRWVVGISSKVVSGSSRCSCRFIGLLSINDGKFVVKNAVFEDTKVISTLTLTSESNVFDFLFKSNALLALSSVTRNEQ